MKKTKSSFLILLILLASITALKSQNKTLQKDILLTDLKGLRRIENNNI